MHFLSYLLLTASIAVTSYIAGIAGIMVFKGCSAKQASAITQAFVRDIFSNNLRENSCYPVLIGWDGCRVVPAFVNEAFKNVRSHFAVCYFAESRYLASGNVVGYRFSIQRILDPLADDPTLERLIQKQAEEILMRHFQELLVNYPVEPLTAVKLDAHNLVVLYALRPEGIGELDRLKQRIMKRRLEEQAPKQPERFEETWKGEDQ